MIRQLIYGSGGINMLANNIVEQLLEIEAVFLRPNDPFTWSSGLKSPIYCDNRLTLSYPTLRKEIASGLSKLVQDHYPEVEMIAGTATAGIPHAAWVSRSEEHTSELQSRENIVCRLLLEKKKK